MFLKERIDWISQMLHVLVRPVDLRQLRGLHLILLQSLSRGVLRWPRHCSIPLCRVIDRDGAYSIENLFVVSLRKLAAVGWNDLGDLFPVQVFLRFLLSATLISEMLASLHLLKFIFSFGIK